MKIAVLLSKHVCVVSQVVLEFLCNCRVFRFQTSFFSPAQSPFLKKKEEFEIGLVSTVSQIPLAYIEPSVYGV